MTGSVFISYRREDSSGYARALYNELRGRLGADKIFMDVDAIEPGLDFVDAIEKAVGKCDVLLALIGPGWLTTHEDGRLRLHDQHDYVRSEIRTALERKIRVIPVLLGGAGMPDQEAMPEDLNALLRRNAIEIRHTHFDVDVESLIKVLVKLVDSKPAAARPQPKDRPKEEAAPRPPVDTKPKPVVPTPRPPRRWVHPALWGVFFVVMGVILGLLIDDMRTGYGNDYRTVYEDEAFLTAAVIVTLGFAITLAVGRLGRRRWWLGTLFGLVAFAALGFGTGFWLDDALNVRYDEAILTAAGAVWFVGLLVSVGKGFSQRRSSAG